MGPNFLESTAALGLHPAAAKNCTVGYFHRVKYLCNVKFVTIDQQYITLDNRLVTC